MAYPAKGTAVQIVADSSPHSDRHTKLDPWARAIRPPT